jgi:hypothetical protein
MDCQSLLATSGVLVFLDCVRGALRSEITFRHFLRMNRDEVWQMLTPMIHDSFLGQF